jgi:hypothetical protein
MPKFQNSSLIDEKWTMYLTYCEWQKNIFKSMMKQRPLKMVNTKISILSKFFYRLQLDLIGFVNILFVILYYGTSI